MNLLNSCQAITYSLLSHQPWPWYGSLLLILVIAKLGLTMLKLFQETAQLHRQALATPVVLTELARRHHFPLNQLLCVQQAQPLAFTFGWHRPTIVLSTGLIKKLTMPELEAVFLHEVYHARHRHPFWFSLGKIVSSLLFIFPVIEDVHQYLAQLWETQADSFAIEAQQSATHLKQALAKVIRHTQPIYATAFAALKLESRIQHLTDQTPLSLSLSPLKMLISTLALTSLGWLLQQNQQAHAWAQNHLASQNCSFSQCVTECVGPPLAANPLISRLTSNSPTGDTTASSNYSPWEMSSSIYE